MRVALSLFSLLVAMSTGAIGCGGGQTKSTAQGNGAAGVSEVSSVARRVVYDDARNGFRLRLPPGWGARRNLHGTPALEFARLRPTEDDPVVTGDVAVHPVRPGTSLDELARATRVLFAGVPGYQVVGVTDATLDGHPAKRVEWTGVLNDRDARGTHVVTVAGDRSYMLTVLADRDAYEQVKPQIDEIVALFELTK